MTGDSDVLRCKCGALELEIIAQPTAMDTPSRGTVAGSADGRVRSLTTSSPRLVRWMPPMSHPDDL